MTMLKDAAGLFPPIADDAFYALPSTPEPHWFHKRKAMRRRRATTADDEKQILLWSEFPRQQMAFDFGDKIALKCATFSYQPAQLQGAQRYVVTNYDSFWTRYCALPAEQRHFYEVIKSGCVANLYFDVEFRIAHNPTKNGAHMVQTFKRLLCLVFAAQFGANTLHVDNIVDLAGTALDNASKFSSHLIVRSPAVVFRDAPSMGWFVRLLNTEIRQMCQDETALGAEARSLFVVDEKAHSNDALFIDFGVYTRNRLFRLFKSSKLGKTATLRVSDTNSFAFADEKDFFLASLVLNVELSDNKRVVGATGPRLTLSNRSMAAGASSDEVKRGSNGDSNDEPASSATTPSDAPPAESGAAASPYPRIDLFIRRCAVLRRGGVQGEIRLWIYFPTTKTLLYEIGKNRFCGNVGRAHKSNHVFLVCDLANMIFYQKCHDFDCRGYRSQEWALPDELDPFAPSPNSDQWITDAELLDAIAQNPSAWP